MKKRPISRSIFNGLPRNMAVIYTNNSSPAYSVMVRSPLRPTFPNMGSTVVFGWFKASYWLLIVEPIHQQSSKLIVELASQGAGRHRVVVETEIDLIQAMVWLIEAVVGLGVRSHMVCVDWSYTLDFFDFGGASQLRLYMHGETGEDFISTIDSVAEKVLMQVASPQRLQLHLIASPDSPKISALRHSILSISARAADAELVIISDAEVATAPTVIVIAGPRH